MASVSSFPAGIVRLHVPFTASTVRSLPDARYVSPFTTTCVTVPSVSSNVPVTVGVVSAVVSVVTVGASFTAVNDSVATVSVDSSSPSLPL